MQLRQEITKRADTLLACEAKIAEYRHQYREQPDRPLPKYLTQPWQKATKSLETVFFASVSRPQVEAFGVERFQRLFIRADQFREYVASHPQLGPEFALLSGKQADAYIAEKLAKIWKYYPDPLAKRFQELFSEPRKFVIPKFSISRQGRFEFNQESVRELALLTPCLVSPERLPDTLVESLGLVKSSKEERRRDSVVSFLRKSQPDVIEGVKERFLCTRALADGDNRYRRFDKTLQREVAHLYKNAPPWPKGLHGSLVLMSEEQGEHARANALSRSRPGDVPASAIIRRAAIFDSINAAHRKTLHQSGGSTLENALVSVMYARLVNLAERLEKEWTRSASLATKKQIQKAAKQLADDIGSEFDGDTDPRKAGAVEIAARFRECRDCLNRLNPQANAKLVEKAAQFLRLRINELGQIEGFNAKDRHSIAAIGVLQSTLLDEQILALRARPYNERLGVSNQAEFLGFVRAAQKSLESVNVRPLSTLAAIARLNMIAIRQATNHSQVKRASQAISRIRPLLGAILATELIREQLTAPEQLNGLALMKPWRKLDANVKAMHSLLGKEPAVFCCAVKGLIDEFSLIEQTEQGYAEYAKRLKLMLDDGINFEELAWQLAPASRDEQK